MKALRFLAISRAGNKRGSKSGNSYEDGDIWRPQGVQSLSLFHTQDSYQDG